VDVVSGDMPTDTVIRADKGKNPAADALAGWERSKPRKLTRHCQRLGRQRSAPKVEKPVGPAPDPRALAHGLISPRKGYTPAA
jgi:hypothetical protein